MSHIQFLNSQGESHLNWSHAVLAQKAHRRGTLLDFAQRDHCMIKKCTHLFPNRYISLRFCQGNSFEGLAEEGQSIRGKTPVSLGRALFLRQSVRTLHAALQGCTCTLYRWNFMIWSCAQNSDLRQEKAKHRVLLVRTLFDSVNRSGRCVRIDSVAINQFQYYAFL